QSANDFSLPSAGSRSLQPALLSTASVACADRDAWNQTQVRRFSPVDANRKRWFCGLIVPVLGAPMHLPSAS
ncbi:MAG: hypothetical protein ACKPJJ_05755, partial [Planctomycetaceae bacterium]